jgi:hypothetical protein
VVAKKAPPKKAPKKELPTTADVDGEEEKEEEENKQQIQVKQQALVARPQQPIAARNNIPVDPYAFSPEDETNDANKKYLFSVMCRMEKIREDEERVNIPLQLEIEKEATISDLKKKISDRTGGKLALNDMILTMGANVLKRSMTCRQAGIKNNLQVILTLKGDLEKEGAYLSDERDMTQQEVALALRKVGVEVDIIDDMDPEDKVKSQQKKPYRNADGKAKDRERFTEEEVKALIDGVAAYGLGKWSEILTQSFGQSERTGVDLKDKWRNLTLAASRPPGFTFRVSYMNPELLQRVRDVKRQVEEKKKRDKQVREMAKGKSRQTVEIGTPQAAAVEQMQIANPHGDLGYHA